MSEDDMVERVAREIYKGNPLLTWLNRTPIPLRAFAESDREMLLLPVRATIEAYKAALAEAGYVIVPREPTQEMLKAGWYEAHEEDALGTWQVMVDAAPKD